MYHMGSATFEAQQDRKVRPNPDPWLTVREGGT